MTISFFNYSNYKQLVNDLIANMPSGGRGQYSKIAHYLKINTVVVSQIFRGQRELSLEHALLLSKHFGFSELQKEFFICLVQKERAAHYELKSYFESKLKNIKKQSQEIKNIVKNEELKKEAQRRFYSSWYYSAIRLSTLLEDGKSAEAIAKKLKLSEEKTREAVQFLLTNGLILQEKGKLKIGPQKTHIGSDSPYVIQHHMNWRLQGFSRMENLAASELFYTAPMVLSRKMMEELKEKILDLIKNMQEEIKNVKDEKMACLNIDLFDVD